MQLYTYDPEVDPAPVLFRQLSVIGRDPTDCSFQFISEAFNSTTESGYIAAVHGDALGSPFTHLHVNFFVTLECENGGIVGQDGRCQCTSNYQNWNCAQPRCLNGATVNGAVCNCAVGFFGQFCQNGTRLPQMGSRHSDSAGSNDDSGAADDVLHRASHTLRLALSLRILDSF